MTYQALHDLALTYYSCCICYSSLCCSSCTGMYWNCSLWRTPSAAPQNPLHQHIGTGPSASLPSDVCSNTSFLTPLIRNSPPYSFSVTLHDLIFLAALTPWNYMLLFTCLSFVSSTRVMYTPWWQKPILPNLRESPSSKVAEYMVDSRQINTYAMNDWIYINCLYTNIFYDIMRQ